MYRRGLTPPSASNKRSPTPCDWLAVLGPGPVASAVGAVGVAGAVGAPWVTGAVGAACGAVAVGAACGAVAVGAACGSGAEVGSGGWFAGGFELPSSQPLGATSGTLVILPTSCSNHGIWSVRASLMRDCPISTPTFCFDGSVSRRNVEVATIVLTRVPWSADWATTKATTMPAPASTRVAPKLIQSNQDGLSIAISHPSPEGIV